MILATLDAILNGTAAICLSIGYYFMRTKQIARHRRAMLTAFVVSVCFLVTYVIHHVQVGSVPFQHAGLVHTLYLAILVPHVILAAVVVPLAVLTLYRGWTEKIALHKRIAKITLPIWLYVSVSGVVVYLMLYWL
ncbi:MAG TPA: DUF420 domain-containing protein [Polyangiaceae bacterium]|jgi:uncharacterized membrane protein YozB (DUF420 family)